MPEMGKIKKEAVLQRRILTAIYMSRAVDAKQVKVELLRELSENVKIDESRGCYKKIRKGYFLTCLHKLCENTGMFTGSDTARHLARFLSLNENRDLYEYILNGKRDDRVGMEVRQRDLRQILGSVLLCLNSV